MTKQHCGLLSINYEIRPNKRLSVHFRYLSVLAVNPSNRRGMMLLIHHNHSQTKPIHFQPMSPIQLINYYIITCPHCVTVLCPFLFVPCLYLYYINSTMYTYTYIRFYNPVVCCNNINCRCVSEIVSVAVKIVH